MRSKLMVLKFCFVAVLLVMFTLNTATAQESFQPFSGRGLGGDDTLPPEPTFFQRLLGAKSPPPKKYSAPFARNSLNTSPSQPASQPGFFQNMNFGWLQPRDPNAEPVRPFSGLANLMPQRELGEPTLFEKFNLRSKAMIDQTADWAHEKNQNFKNRTIETWSFLTQGLRGESDEDSFIPARPPIRSANAADDSVKY